jgi:prolyl oligopeptidase
MPTMLSSRFVTKTLPSAASLAATSLLCASTGALRAQALHYPPARRDTLVADYFGTKVPAPYRWMEDLNSPEVKAWVDAENRLTFSYLDKIQVRPWIQKRLEALWNYERVGAPDREGGKLFFSRNTGLQNQSVVYVADSLGGTPRTLLDPNVRWPKGNTALAGWNPSPDGRYVEYATSEGGSDWRVFHVRDVATGKDLPDIVRWAKFSGVSWTKDGEGFFYSRFAEPPAGQAISQQVTNQKFYYHRLGTPQSQDRLIYERPDRPDWYIGGGVTEDGRYAFISMSHGTESANELYYMDLGDPQHPSIDATVQPLYTKNDAEYRPIGVEGDTVYLQTNLDAPKNRIVAAVLSDPSPDHWRVVVPEGENVISGSTIIGGRVLARYLIDVKSQVNIFGRDGTPKGQLELPGIGTVRGLVGHEDSPELFYSFSSFLYPTTIYRFDLDTGKRTTFYKPHVAFDPSGYETKQVFYPSKDGTRIPMFITAKKGIQLDGSHPTVLYAYGGFDISVTPSFSPTTAMWLELGGVYAVATLRGGGEYGQAWHEAGMLGNKQNVFDDFAWAARYLESHGYGTRPHLAIEGYSNGGLLVGASITERPELFGAAYAGAGVMDMLRYQKFSAGIGWVPEYGSSDDSTAFQWLYKFSPVHNTKAGSCYPPTIITTADHDDRVVPSHSYKFAAAMQRAQGCDNPILIRVETETSHGYMPTDKRIAQTADIWSFIAYELGVRAAPDPAEER